jgi:hypothetical protein
MRLTMNTYKKEEKCKLCTKIETKEARIRKEEERIRSWQRGGKPLRRLEGQQMNAEWSVVEREGKLLNGSGDQANQSTNDVWDEVEKLKEEINSLLQDRIRARSNQPRVEDIENNEPKVPAPPSATLEGTLKSLRLEPPGEMSPSNIKGSSDPNKGKESGLTRKLMPASRLFPIDVLKDAVLISAWEEQVLPNMKLLLCDGEDTSVSMTLLRQGKTVEDSEPVVRIQTSKPRSEERQGEVMQSITQLLLPILSPRISFVIGSIKRTARRSDLDMLPCPCPARNTAFLRRPPMGVSIGVEGSVKDTATLGGYIYLDGIPYILTVHHLFTDDEISEVFKPLERLSHSHLSKK